VSRNSQLEASMRRFQEAVLRAQEQQRQLSRQWQVHPGQPWAGHPWGYDRREDRKMRKRMWREHRRRHSHPGQIGVGAVMLMFALYFLISASQAHLGWMVWVALGLAIGGASNLSRGVGALRDRQARTEQDPIGEQAPAELRHRESAPAPAPRELEDPRVTKVNQLTDKLLHEVKSGPEILKMMGQDPEKTAVALRTACNELVGREKALRALVREEDDAQLAQEKSELEAKIAKQADPVVKERLGQALTVLADQQRQRAELQVAAARLDAEHTRLYYTLQNLYTQVLRVKSADTGSAEVAGAGLKHSLDQLSEEIDAVAASLEAVNTGTMSAVSPISAPESAEGADSRERQRS
jgi:hypothetical protein